MYSVLSFVMVAQALVVPAPSQAPPELFHRIEFRSHQSEQSQERVCIAGAVSIINGRDIMIVSHGCSVPFRPEAFDQHQKASDVVNSTAAACVAQSSAKTVGATSYEVCMRTRLALEGFDVVP